MEQSRLLATVSPRSQHLTGPWSEHSRPLSVADPNIFPTVLVARKNKLNPLIQDFSVFGEAEKSQLVSEHWILLQAHHAHIMSSQKKVSGFSVTSGKEHLSGSESPTFSNIFCTK